MTVIVFSGPSLSPEAARTLFPEATCARPAAQGDFIRAARARPRALVLIDGYFEHRPAVTHKEILWAMHEGIAVFGASSMGALRAAELAPLGMVGIGKIFEAYASGELEDDDEVAVAHAEAEHQYRPASEALVNLRATLQRARALDVVSAPTEACLIAAAKELFYAERIMPQVLAHARSRGALPSELSALERWLRAPDSYCDQKRADAEALLDAVRALWSSDKLRAPVPPHFARTKLFEQLLQTTSSEPDAAILEELQLLGPEAFGDILFAATRRALCQKLGERDAAGLLDLSAWAERLALAEVPAVLRETGDYERVRARAEAKAKSISAAEPRQHAPERETLRWYFESRLGRSIPEDLEAYARELRLGSAAQLVAAISRERRYTS